MVLNDLQHRGLKPRILELLRKFYFAAEDLTVKIQGGSAQFYLHEKGLRTSPFNMGNRQKHGLFGKNRGRELRKMEPDCKKPRKISHFCMLRGLGLRTPIPATRLSEGTIRFLCLVAILCHPTPSSLVCLEEPELSLHPDIIPSLAEMLDDASERHSSDSDHPLRSFGLGILGKARLGSRLRARPNG